MVPPVESLPFRTLKPWLLETFGRPVYRVALDAGSSCPNRDGTKGFGGCVYCDVEGSGTGALKQGADLEAQLQEGLRRVARRDPDFGVIAYFQSYSNTYVPRDRFREVLQGVRSRLGDPIECVAVATRPDTLGEECLEELANLAREVPVWVELGLESANDQVLLDINRLHTVDEFRTAVTRCHDAGLMVVGHAILGLPGDGRPGAQRTAEVFAETGISGVKVHQLMVLRRTVLEHWWREGRVDVLDVDTYVDWLADFVERLAPEQVLHRLTGDAPLEERLAPRWTVHKNAVRERLAATLTSRGTVQGSRYPKT